MTEHRDKDPHEVIRELCALSTTGTLTIQERDELDAHLRACESCRELYSQYQAIAREGMPFLASNVLRDDDTLPWNSRETRQRLLSSAGTLHPSRPVPISRARSLPIAGIGRWSKAGVAAALLISVSAGSYWLGKRNEASVRSVYVAIAGRFQEASAEKAELDRALATHVQNELQEQANSSRRAHEIEQLRTELKDLDHQSKALAMGVANKDERMRDLAQERDAVVTRLQKVEQAFRESEAERAQLLTVSQERDALAARLRTSEERYQAERTELAKLADQINKEGDPALKTQVRELSARVDEQQQEIQRGQQLLESDRDIRELVSARQLYIADVFDVRGDGSTRKPFGRVFYTREKSLIFYAFDLDRQPGIKNTSTFQAWGQKDAAPGEHAQPLSLGILYLDSQSNRRWALRADNPKQLAEIDAIFVTVEPHGGSRLPTGKPFLYALLRKEANHP